MTPEQKQTLQDGITRINGQLEALHTDLALMKDILPDDIYGRYEGWANKADEALTQARYYLHKTLTGS